MMDKTILLVDYDPIVLNCLGDLLRRSRYMVIAECEASAAFAESTTGTSIDLVITDRQMAGMDGLEFLFSNIIHKKWTEQHAGNTARSFSASA